MREIEAPVEEYLESEKDCEDLEDDYDFVLGIRTEFPVST